MRSAAQRATMVATCGPCLRGAKIDEPNAAQARAWASLLEAPLDAARLWRPSLVVSLGYGCGASTTSCARQGRGAGAPPLHPPTGRFPKRVPSTLWDGRYDAATAAAPGWARVVIARAKFVSFVCARSCGSRSGAARVARKGGSGGPGGRSGARSAGRLEAGGARLREAGVERRPSWCRASALGAQFGRPSQATTVSVLARVVRGRGVAKTSPPR